MMDLLQLRQNIRAFYEKNIAGIGDDVFMQLVARIPWKHNMILI